MAIPCVVGCLAILSVVNRLDIKFWGQHTTVWPELHIKLAIGWTCLVRKNYKALNYLSLLYFRVGS